MRSFFGRFSVNGNAASIVVASLSSCPRIASSTSAQSSAVSVSGPILSSDQHKVIAPARLTLPKVGRNPVTPQTVAGDMMDPIVSDPIANGKRPAATPEAEPADEPLEPFSKFQGLRVRPPYHTSPIANSPRLVLA